MDSFEELLGLVTELVAEVAELKRRVANQVRHGPVSDVDAAKQLCRVELGKDADGQTFKSDWIPYAQLAGTRKLHLVPSVGQNMTMLAPSGDVAQAIAVPFTWSETNASPSTREDQVVFEFGDVRIEIEAGVVRIKVGDTELELTPRAINQVSGSIHLAGDTHLGVDGKGAKGDRKVEVQTDIPAQRVWAKA